MNAETFLGNEIIEIYKQIHSKYPNGVNYQSTKQLVDGDRIRYSVSFIPILEIDNILEANDALELDSIEIHPRDEYPDDFLDTIKEIEKELEDIESNSNVNAMEQELTKEIQALEDISSALDEIKEPCIKTIQKELVKMGISEKWLQSTLDGLIMSDITEDKNLILNFVLDELESNFTFMNNYDKEPNILMMVGPTGVGKTTSIAKIASNFNNDAQGYDIAFINLDQNRLAASEQLKGYASLFSVDYADLNEENEFIWQLHEYRNKDLIFVDTGGISPFDIKKLLETASFINSASKSKISIALVLPATLKKEDMKRMYENFSFLGLDYLIITKFDETFSITELTDFLKTCNTPMYYFSVGQDLNNNLIPASSEYLRDRLMKEWQSIECKS